jgi:hypothetical protein
MLNPLPIELLSQHVQPNCLKSIAGIDPCPAPVGRPAQQRIAV